MWHFLSALGAESFNPKDPYFSPFKGFLASRMSSWTSMCWRIRLYSCVRHNSLLLCSQNCPSRSSKMKDNGDMSVAYFCFEHVTIADLLDALWECPRQYNCWNRSVNGLKSVIKKRLLSVGQSEGERSSCGVREAPFGKLRHRLKCYGF